MTKIRKGKDIDVRVRLIVNNELADMSQIRDLKVWLKKDKDTVNPLMTNVDFTENPLAFSIKETYQYPVGKYRLTVSWKYNGKRTTHDHILFELVNQSEHEDLKGCTCPCADLVVLDTNMGVTIGKDGKDGRGIEKVEIIDKELYITYTDEGTVNVGEVVRDPYQLAKDHGLPNNITEEQFYKILANSPNYATKQELEDKADIYKIAGNAKLLSDVQVGDNLSGVTLIFDTSTFIGYRGNSSRITFQNGNSINSGPSMLGNPTYYFFRTNIASATANPNYLFFYNSSNWNLQSYQIPEDDSLIVISISIGEYNTAFKMTSYNPEVRINVKDVYEAIQNTNSSVEQINTDIGTIKNEVQAINEDIAEINHKIDDLETGFVQKTSDTVQEINSDLSFKNDKTIFLQKKDGTSVEGMKIGKFTKNVNMPITDIKIGDNLRGKTIVFDTSINSIVPELGLFSATTSDITTVGATIGFGIDKRENEIYQLIYRHRSETQKYPIFFSNGMWVTKSISFDGGHDYIVGDNNLPLSSGGKWGFDKATINTDVTNEEINLGALGEQLTLKTKENVFVDTSEGREVLAYESALESKENISNKVEISSTATSGQYPTAKSVFDLIQDVAATIPASGLKIPISVDFESQLPDVSTLTPGDYFFVQEMDQTAPERTGRAWVNYTNPKDTQTPLKYYKVIDQYQSMDSVSITQTGGGAWEINSEWLNQKIVGKLDKVDLLSDYNQAYIKTSSGEQILVNVANNHVANSIPLRDIAGNIKVNLEVGSNNDATSRFYVDTADNKKLNKVEHTTSNPQVYIKGTNGAQLMYDFTSQNIGATVISRDDYGNASVSDPINNDHIANKGYVDNKLMDTWFKDINMLPNPIAGIYNESNEHFGPELALNRNGCGCEMINNREKCILNYILKTNPIPKNTVVSIWHTTINYGMLFDKNGYPYIDGIIRLKIPESDGLFSYMIVTGEWIKCQYQQGVDFYLPALKTKFDRDIPIGTILTFEHAYTVDIP